MRYFLVEYSSVGTCTYNEEQEREHEFNKSCVGNDNNNKDKDTGNLPTNP